MELPRFVSGVLVVPPCDCVWLTGDEFYLSGSRRLCFEAKAKHDVTIILRNSPGTKRLEHSLPEGSETCSYTIKIGSHRNTAVEFERNGATVSSAKTTALDQWFPRFASFWVQLCYGVLTVGSGEPRSCNVIHRWKDPSPGSGVMHVGFSAWDDHVVYRSIAIRALGDDPLPSSLPPSRPRTPLAEPVHPPGAAPLLRLSSRALRDALEPRGVCTVLLKTSSVLLPCDVRREVHDSAADFAAANLLEVLRQDPEGFRRLPGECLARVASAPLLGGTEADLFEAIAETWWRGRGAPGRGRGALTGAFDRSGNGCGDDDALHLEQSLQHVRYQLMSEKELAAAAEHPAVQRNPKLRARIAETVPQSPPHPTSELCLQGRVLYRMPPEQVCRSVSSLRGGEELGTLRYELMYVCDGDSNGVCSFLGTAMGTQAFMNPVVDQRMSVSCSSPGTRHCNPKMLMSRKFSKSLFAGPRLCEDGELRTWWEVDLGPRRRLAVNYYTIRHDGSDAFARSWSLQGSSSASGDGSSGSMSSSSMSSSWTTLRTHLDDPSLGRPGQFCSWPVPPAPLPPPQEGLTASSAALCDPSPRPFRRLRVVLNGPNAAKNPAEARRLHMSMLEFYGTLFVDTP